MCNLVGKAGYYGSNLVSYPASLLKKPTQEHRSGQNISCPTKKSWVGRDGGGGGGIYPLLRPLVLPAMVQDVKRWIYFLCVLLKVTAKKECMARWTNEVQKPVCCWRLGEGAKNWSVHIWNFYCFEPPIFRGTEPGFFFLNFLPQKVCSLFFTLGSFPVLIFQQQAVLHGKNDHFHSTLWIVLIVHHFVYCW